MHTSSRIVSCVIAAVLGSSTVFAHAEPDQDHPTLENMVSSARWTEARLSMDHTGSVCVEHVADQTQSLCTIIFPIAERSLEFAKIAYDRENLTGHERAVLRILRNGRNTTRARQLLENELTHDINNVALWNDLGVAILAAAEESSDWQLLDAAAMALNTALEIDPQYVRALFNLALLQTRLSLNEQAVHTWNNYLKIETDSSWIDEAKQRIEKIRPSKTSLELPFASVFLLKPEAARLWVQEEPSKVRALIYDTSQFLKEFSAESKQICNRNFPGWHAVGGQLGKTFGDSFLANSLDWLCNPENDRSRIELGLSALEKSVNAYYVLMDETAAIENASMAMEYLTGSPLVSLALYLRAAALFVQEEYVRSTEDLRKLLDTSDPSHLVIRAKALSVLGSINIRAKENQAADEQFREAISLLVSGVDPALQVRVSSLAAESLSRSGRYEDAWDLSLSALAAVNSGKLSRRTKAKTCGFTALVAEQSGAKYLRKSYSECAVGNLTETASPSERVSTYLSRAAAKAALGDLEGAKVDTALAEQAARFASSQIEEAGLLAFIDLRFGLLWMEQNPASAQDYLTRATSYFRQSGNREYEMRALQALLKVHQTQSNSDAESVTLKRLIDIIRPAQAASKTGEFSLSIFNHHRTVFDYITDQKLGQDDFEGALLNHLESRAGREIQPETLYEVISNTPDSASLILAWRTAKVTGWLLMDGKLIRSFSSELPDGDTVVARAAGTSKTPFPGGTKAALAQLFNTLILPVEEELGDVSVLRIFPDDVLFGIPFGALWNSKKSQYLINDTSIIVTPDLRTSPSSTKSRIGTVAIFSGADGNPTRRLNSVTVETQNLASSLSKFSTVRVFTGRNSNKTNFRDSLSKFDIVHFGGHGEVNPRSPLESRLILRDGDDDASTLTASDIYSWKLERMPRLVVLAACDTAAYSDRLPHAVALVRPLLERGTQQVLGSLKPIPDERYREFMESFYLFLKEEQEPHQALRSVQMKYSAGTDARATSYWQYLQIYQL